MEALVFDVQRFSIHDGPGIRTTIFFKGCPLRCRFCQNPESLRPEPELAFYAERCRQHGACRAACPRGAIIERGPERVQRELCDACGKCVPACPYGALCLVGRRVPVDELAATALRDEPFYRSSGGGVTLSGGEPTLQLEAALALAEACRARGLSVGMQTCGQFRFADLGPHLALFDFLHFDLKLIDGEAHRRLTGADNGRILENARQLAAAGAPVTFRAPVIPGWTDRPDNLDALAAFLAELGGRTLHLLRYHRLGQSKRPRLGHAPSELELPAGADAAASLTAAARRLAAAGLEVTT